MMKNRSRLLLTLIGLVLLADAAIAQERVTLWYSSVEAPNANWFIAHDRRLYQKYGVEAESIFIPSSSTVINAIIGGSVQLGNGTGGAIANAAVAGANLVAVGSFINTLPYELIVQESIKSAAGKIIGIARIGSASDVAARVLIKGLGLDPDKDVAIIQGGGGSERVAAFRGGRIAGFPSPPGVIQLAKKIPHRMEIQIKEAIGRRPNINLKTDVIIDDSLVLQLEKEGFIERLYRQ